VTRLPFRRLFALLATVLIVGCGAEPDAAQKKPPPAPEPAEAPPLDRKPAGRVVEVGPAPEGIAADPRTGLVAIALRNPNELALVDGDSGETVRKVNLPESARHLDLAAPGGPVLVPAEGADSLLQVRLPEGEITDETPVGDFPHAAASAPGGRIFVANEKGSTVSVVEDGRETEVIQAPFKPGGVAVTNDGLVGVVGVRALTHVRAGPGNRFYVADTRGDAVFVYGTDPEPKQLDRVSLPGSPYGMAIDPVRDHLWVTLTAEQSVVELAPRGNTIREIGRYPTVRQPNSVAVDTATGRVFVTGKADGQLQILDPR
jgi:DNA-binding beta-propeller fold protein YncE